MCVEMEDMRNLSTISSRILMAALLTGTLATASACNASNSDSPTSPSNSDNSSLVTVFIKNSVYSPNPVTVNVGQQINWKNDDSIIHSAETTSGVMSFSSVDISPNSAQGAPITMNVRGTINYKCRQHGETGVIIVQ